MGSLIRTAHRSLAYAGALWAVLLCIAGSAAAQTAGDYRTVASGSWGQIPIWEAYGSTQGTILNLGAEPHDVAVDTVGAKLYILNNQAKKIQRSDFQGGNLEDVVIGLNNPTGLDVDAAAGKLYIVDKGTNKVIRTNLDGTGQEDFLTGLTDPRGADVAGDWFYWAEATTDKIIRIDVDGTGQDTLVTETGSLRDVAADSIGGKVYWLHYDAKKIQRANLDGTGVEDLVTGLSDPIGLAVDIAAGKLYISDASTDKIIRANLDGTGQEDLITGLADPRGIDVGSERFFWSHGNQNTVGCHSLSTGWNLACRVPALADGTITVRNGHTVTLPVDTNIDQLVIEAGGQITTDPGKLRLQDGAGTDLIVEGTLYVVDNVQIELTSTAEFRSGSVLDVNGQFKVKDDSVVDFLAGASVVVNVDFIKTEQQGLLRVASGVTVTNHAATDGIWLKSTSTAEFNGATLVNNGGITIESGAGLTFNGGALTNAGTLTQQASSVLTFGSGSTYEHAQDGGALPYPGLTPGTDTVWNAGSTCLVTGTVATLPTNLGHSFHHVTWNATSQTAALDLAAAPLAIGGDLAVSSTGSGTLSWVQSLNTDLVVGGSYTQTGGTFIYTDGTGTGTMDVAGDLSVSGGELKATNGAGAPTLAVTGDVTVTAGGTLSADAAGSATLLLDGAAQQTVTGGGTLSGTLDLELNNAAGAVLASAFGAARHVTVTAGTLDLGGFDLSIGGDLTVSGGLTNPATLTFDGAAAQSFSYAATLSLPELVIDNSGGATVTLAAGTNLDVTTGLKLAAGTLDVNGQAVTLKASGGRTAPLYDAGGGLTGSLTMERYYGNANDGWRLLSVPLTGPTYSDLNATFHTQGGEWATYGAGNSNLRSLDFAAQDWTEITGADAAFATDDGYIFYMWQQDGEGNTRLPATWSVTGTLSGATSKSLGFNTSAADSYTLVGNPLGANLDWDDMVTASTNVGTTYAVWDPALTDGGGMSGFKYYNSSGGTGDASPYIAPFQAFFAQATAGGASLSYASSQAAYDATPDYFGKQAGSNTAREGAAPHLRLHLQGEGSSRGLGEHETYLVFDPLAVRGRDDFDVLRLMPFTPDYATLFFEADDGGRLAFDGRSMETGAEDFHLHLATTRGGSYELSWPDRHEIPDAWTLTLVDAATGRTVDLRQQASYRFEADATAGAGKAGALGFATAYSATGSARFTLQVRDPARAASDTPPEAELPGHLLLEQNYPNPFNPATTIRYALPERMPVRLVVYDLLGRTVETLVAGEQAAGSYDVRWEAADRPSGVYLYRLEAGGRVQTRRMLLLK